MATIAELKAGVVDQLRRVRLEEKRLRSGALGYDAGELDLGDLALTSLRYAAEVRVYREMELALQTLGVAVPKAVRDGGTAPHDWEPVEDALLTSCTVRRGTTLQ